MDHDLTSESQYCNAKNTHTQGACLVRVPTENVKQNLQAGRFATHAEAVQTIMKVEGVGGFYKGFLSTVFREVRACREGERGWNPG